MQYDVSEYQLKNGGRGLIINVAGAPVMSSQFQFRAGNRYVLDYANKSQTAHIMEHMAFGASDGFASAHDYDAAFTKNGAFHNAYTDDISMVYEASCADFEWNRILNLQRYAICQPHFDQEDFVLESIPNITVEDVREHWHRTHTGGNMRFVVAGNFDGRLTQLRDILNSFELAQGDRLPIAVDEMHSAPAFAIRRKDVPGIGLAISLVVSRKLSDGETQAMDILNHILNGTLHSRIQGEARRRGLLYYMWSQLSTFEHNSSWDFGAQVSVANLPAVIELARQEIERVRDGLIDETELNEAKSYLLGRHQMGTQTVGQIANWFAEHYFFDGVIADFSAVPDRINAITKEQIVEIGPRFRNEGIDDEHLPEHVAMEWYHAYWDWRDGMRFMEEMYKYVIKQTFGKLHFQIGDFDVDLDKEWEVWDYAEVIKKNFGIDVYNTTLDEVKAKLIENKIEVGKAENISRGIDKLWKHIRKDVAGPVWLVNTPKFISPLSKANPDGVSTQRFQPVIAGSELGNGYSELNNPIDQLSRFVEQQQMRDAGDDEAMMLDIDFVEMLEYGMPPACGWGYSERVFWIFEGVTAREGVPFPTMRHEIDQVTKKIYPDVKL